MSLACPADLPVPENTRLAIIGQQPSQFLLGEPVLFGHLAHFAHRIEQPFGIEDAHRLIACRRDHDAHDMAAASDANRLALVERVCRECGYEPPRIVTPIELMEV